MDGGGRAKPLLSLNGCDWYKEAQVGPLVAVTAREGGLLLELL